jgi:acetyl-CoA carboxylase carboxyltransferase component
MIPEGQEFKKGFIPLARYGDIFYYNTLASGYIPQISIIAGPCAGGAVYSPGLTDFVFVIDGISNMFVTGPKVVKCVTNEVVTTGQLGGSTVHAAESGVAHFRYATEEDAYSKVRYLLSKIPHYHGDALYDAHIFQDKESDIASILPERNCHTYDMKRVIYALTDSFIEIHEHFARNAVVGLAKLSGIRVGIVANQPSYIAGVIDIDASDKIARFVRYCDCFDIPLIILTDVPGFMPGLDQETKEIIRHGAKVLYAYSEATVPKINVILRKAYGGAYIAMCSKHLGADFVYAWPRAEVAVMGAGGAVDVLFGQEIKHADNPEEFREHKIEEYKADFLTSSIVAKYGYVDEVIAPEDTRRVLHYSLSLLVNKKTTLKIEKKHGNMPL